MKNYKNIILNLWIILLFTSSLVTAQELSKVQPEVVGFSSERLERLSTTLNAYVNDGKLSGGVALVARHGKIAFFEAFGKRDMESNSPMQNNSIFRIASQTKALVSVGIMILQEEGKLLITDRLSNYLPEFKETTVAVPTDNGGYNIVKSKRPIIIRDLLTHTSGISYGNGPAAELWKKAGIQNWYFSDRDEPISETVSRMASLPFDSQPGEKWVYGYSTDILGVVIEKVSGQSLSEFITSNILKPLGMQDTHFYLPMNKTNRLATVYSATNNGLRRAPTPGTMVSQGAYVNGPRKSYSGGAGLLSTATDYAIFLQMMLNGGEYDGVRILAPKTVELMTVNHLRDIPFSNGNGFGLGFQVLLDLGANGQTGSVGEYGWGGAYHSTYWVDPKEDMVVVYFTQLIPTMGLDDERKLRTLIYQAIIK